MAATFAVVILIAGECVAYALLQRRQGNYNYAYQAYVLWQVAPSPNGAIHLGPDGLRLTANTTCDGEAFTIWMFGGSGLWGNFVQDGETIPSYLAQIYQQKGRPACVRNFGQRGWTNTQEVIKLMLELKQASRPPDVVLFYDGSVDSSLPYEPDEPDVHMGFERFKQKFEGWQPGREAGFGYLRSTNTFQALRWLAEWLNLDRNEESSSSIPDARLAATSERTVRNYRKNIDIVDALAARYAFRYTFMLEPLLIDALKPLNPAETRLVQSESRTVSGKVMADGYRLLRSAPLPHFVNLRDIFKDHPEPLFIDTSHVNAAGDRIIADAIAGILQGLGS